MKLSSLLENNLIFYNLPGDSLEKLFYSLITRITNVDRSFSKISQKLIKSSSNLIETFIENGVVFPYISTNLYNDTIISIGFPDKPIETTNGEVRVIFFAIFPKRIEKTMSSVIESVNLISRDSSIIDDILNISPDKLIEYIKGHERILNEKIDAQSIMRGVDPTYLDVTIGSVVNRMSKEMLDAIPVLNSENLFLGEISNLEIIRSGMPSVTSVLVNPSFLNNLEPFEEYFKNKNTLKVRDIFNKKLFTVSPDTGVMEISWIMIKKKIHRVYVVDKDRYMGVVSRDDIVKKAMRS
jgi:PTS system nitrogen regulatory IIA component